MKTENKCEDTFTSKLFEFNMMTLNVTSLLVQIMSISENKWKSILAVGVLKFKSYLTLSMIKFPMQPYL